MKQRDLFERKAQSRIEFTIVANTDGGARDNPGPAAYGVVIRNDKGQVLAKLSEYLGIQTNNAAEYSGLLAALEWTVREQQPSLKVLSDSQLVVQQMRGNWKVKDPGLKKLFDRAQSLVAKLRDFAIEYVPRELNRDADRLVIKVLDNHAK